MQLKTAAQTSSQILYYNDLLTCIYLPVFAAYLYYSRLWLRIGHLENANHILVLLFLETAKYMFYVSRTQPKYGIREFLKRLFTVPLLLATVYVIAVLFGAPVFSHFEETIMFSLLLTVLAAFPLCMYFGSGSGVTLFLSIGPTEDNDVHKLFVLKVRLTALGAWLGATVIPLDWNRPWQDWPIPCCVGTVLGHIVAVWVCTFLQYRSRVLSQSKIEKHV